MVFTWSFCAFYDIPGPEKYVFFTQCFLASACFVVSYFSFFEQTVLVVFPDDAFITIKSPIFFFIFLQMATFEDFQYDVIFDISKYAFPAS